MSLNIARLISAQLPVLAVERVAAINQAFSEPFWSSGEVSNFATIYGNQGRKRYFDQTASDEYTHLLVH